MGTAISSIYTILFTSQLHNVETEATLLMRNTSANLERQQQQLNKSKSDTLSMPNKEDYYYEQLVGIVDEEGNQYTVDTKSQNYTPVTTENGTYINLTATTTSQGSTLKISDSAVVSEDGSKIGEYPIYDIETALSEGDISEESCNKLIESAVHYFQADMGFDGNGDLKCTIDYIKNNFNLVKIGDDQWGLVSKSANPGEKTSIYQVNENGEYKIPKQIQAYDIQMDARGNITGFKDANNNDVKLTTKTVFDQKGYDATMNEWNLKQKAEEEENDKNEELAQADASLEARLSELSTMKTLLDGFLESTKKIAKECAERSGKTFGG